MRQILFGDQWVHPQEPEQIVELFRVHGTRRRVHRGTELLHGGPDGEVCLLEKGMCFYSCMDWAEHERIISLILPGRVIGDIDGMLNAVANISATAAEDCDLLVIPQAKWHRLVTGNATILELQTRQLLLKEECHIEGLLACLSMGIEQRLQALLHAVIRAFYTPDPDDWNEMPVRLNTVILAKFLSSTRTSVSLILSRWTEQGLFRKDGKTYFVHGKLFAELYDWWADRSEMSRSKPLH